MRHMFGLFCGKRGDGSEVSKRELHGGTSDGVFLLCFQTGKL